MTHIAVLGNTNRDLVACVEKAPQRGETVAGREFRTLPGGTGASASMPYRSETEARYSA
nr:hypothetical protein [Streptomyces sp. MMG1533]